jgi:hypothetical protein
MTATATTAHEAMNRRSRLIVPMKPLQGIVFVLWKIRRLELENAASFAENGFVSAVHGEEVLCQNIHA